MKLWEWCRNTHLLGPLLGVVSTMATEWSALKKPDPHCSRRGERGMGVDDAEDWRKGMHAGDILAGGY
jgi:hypothetical protein